MEGASASCASAGSSGASSAVGAPNPAARTRPRSRSSSGLATRFTTRLACRGGGPGIRGSTSTGSSSKTRHPAACSSFSTGCPALGLNDHPEASRVLAKELRCKVQDSRERWGGTDDRHLVERRPEWAPEPQGPAPRARRCARRADALTERALRPAGVLRARLRLSRPSSTSASSVRCSADAGNRTFA